MISRKKVIITVLEELTEKNIGYTGENK